MRRDLCKRMPALTRFYGLRPWEVEDLTLEELGEYLGQLSAWERQQVSRGDVDG